ncbi:MAG: CAP domain-containing protein [Bradymonadia bacterium]
MRPRSSSRCAAIAMLAMLLSMVLGGSGTAAQRPEGSVGPAEELQRLLSVHGFAPPLREAALDRAASALAERLAGPPGDAPQEAATEHLAHLLSVERVSDAQVFPMTVRHRQFPDFSAHLPSLLGRLDRTKAPTHFGASTFVRNGALTTAVLLVHRGLVLEQPLPRTGEPGGYTRVRGQLERGYFRPRVLVAPPNGARIRERPAWSTDRSVDVTLHFAEGPGVYGIEVVADSQYGPVVLNNHEVYVGVPAPDLAVLRLEPPASEAAPDATLLRLVNEQRAASGVAVLRVWPELTSVARDWSTELAAQRVLVHATADAGTLTTRLVARGLRFTQAGENLANASTPRQALAAMLSSPGHKKNLLDPRWTHVGVGVSSRYYVLAFVRLAP